MMLKWALKGIGVRSVHVLLKQHLHLPLNRLHL
jgi:hypothetical protein